MGSTYLVRLMTNACTHNDPNSRGVIHRILCAFVLPYHKRAAQTSIASCDSPLPLQQLDVGTCPCRTHGNRSHIWSRHTRLHPDIETRICIKVLSHFADVPLRIKEQGGASPSQGRIS